MRSFSEPDATEALSFCPVFISAFHGSVWPLSPSGSDTEPHYFYCFKSLNWCIFHMHIHALLIYLCIWSQGTQAVLQTGQKDSYLSPLSQCIPVDFPWDCFVFAFSPHLFNREPRPSRWADIAFCYRSQSPPQPLHTHPLIIVSPWLWRLVHSLATCSWHP